MMGDVINEKCAINKVCAIIDAQGFVMDGKFFPRVISVISNSFKQTVLCDSGLRRSFLTVQDRITNNYISNNIIGLSMGNHDLGMKHKMSDDGYQVIYNIYDMVKTNKKKYIAISNDQIEEILRYWQIPYIKLQDCGCPGIEKLRKLYPMNICHFHNRAVPDRKKLRCAEEKCEMVWQWLIEHIKKH